MRDQNHILALDAKVAAQSAMQNNMFLIGKLLLLFNTNKKSL